MDFKIRSQSKKSEDRPWDYVVLRHYRSTRTTSPSMAKISWGTSTPCRHGSTRAPRSIQRNTPQTATCDSYHGNADIFLSEEDLLPYEVEANQGVIPEKLPAPIGQ